MGSRRVGLSLTYTPHEMKGVRVVVQVRDPESNRSSEGYLNAWEAAEYLRISPRQVYRMKKDLGGMMLGNRLLFKASEIDRRMDQLRLDRARRR